MVMLGWLVNAGNKGSESASGVCGVISSLEDGSSRLGGKMPSNAIWASVGEPMFDS